MVHALSRCVLGFLLALLTSHGSLVQGRFQADGDRKPGDSPGTAREESDRYILLLRASKSDQESAVILSQLSDLHLSSEQVQEMTLAAEMEKSDEKRIVLWHAIRQSRDTRGRAYLMDSLTRHSSADLQIQFLESLQNPTRHDIPLLVSIYNSRRPRQKAMTTPRPNTAQGDPGNAEKANQADPKAIPSSKDSQADRAWKNKDTDRYEKAPRYKRGQTGEDRETSDAPSKDKVTSPIQEGEASQGARPAKEAQSTDKAKDDGEEPEAELDLLDVPLRIVELACQSDWQNELTFFERLNAPDVKVSDDVNAARMDIRSRKSEEAKLAQEQLLHWLVKNGFDDNHRISAFRKFRNFRTSGRSLKKYADLGSDLLEGMSNPESRATAVPLVTPYIEPTRFLASNEAEIVRLKGLEAMLDQLIECRKAPANSVFMDKAIAYKPVLTHVLNTDPSPAVKEMAKRVKEQIAIYETEIPK